MAAVAMRPDGGFEGQPKGFPFEDFNFEDVMLPENDDMGIPSEDDEVAEEELETETGFGSVIVADNLPEVGPDKYDKLTGLLNRIYGQVGTVREGGINMPRDKESDTSKGFAFIEFHSPEEAAAAKESTDNYKLDRNHTLAVNLFDEIDKYMRIPDEYESPDLKAYAPQEHLRAWLMDKRGRDQFAIRFGDETEVYWNDAARSQPEQVYKRSYWTESFVQWSGQGSYLATIHRQGVAVWGGQSWPRLTRFSHNGVRLIEFSPCESYLITYSSMEPSNPREKAKVLLNVFDTKTGKKLRVFDNSVDEFAIGTAAGPGGALRWPVFKWAGGPKDTFFARLGKNAISIYECPDMGLLDKKSLKLDAVQDFAWSPAEPILCAYQAEQSGGNLPARISLVRIPDRTELRQKNLFSVSDVRMYWHPQGDYLAIKVDRYTKTRKSTFTSFELFSVKERDIPMEVLELPTKTEKVVDFAWEPKGSRFAVLYGDGPRPTLAIYDMKSTTAKGVQCTVQQPNKQANCLHWSPQGKFLVLGGLKALNGQLEFFNAEDGEVMNAAEHFMCTDIEWDPTGRYVATSVTVVHQMENGFNVWLFNGQLLYRMPRERFFQFSWRPRPPTLLEPAKEEEVVKNLKKYSQKYEQEDQALLAQTDVDLLAERQRMMDEWKAWVASKEEWVAQNNAGIAAILGDALKEGEYTVSEVEVEETLGVNEEVIRAT